MSDLLPIDLRTLVDAHLDAVELHLLRSGTPRGKRRGIVDDLETQILDTLADVGRPALSAEDVKTVLSRLDPPEAYAVEPAASLIGSRRGGYLGLNRSFVNKRGRERGFLESGSPHSWC